MLEPTSDEIAALNGIAWEEFKLMVFNGLSSRSKFDRTGDVEVSEDTVYEVLEECKYLLHIRS